jgi:signal transduction histidine kinase
LASDDPNRNAFADLLTPATLRGRLTIGYAAALVVALVAFAAIALAVVDQSQRHALDAQLEATAGALGIVGDIKDGRLAVDNSDRRKFAEIVGTKAESAIFTSDGTLAVSSDDRAATALHALAASTTAPAHVTTTIGGQRVRAYAQGIEAGGHRVGTLVTWRDLAPVESLDRSLALAFALAIPAIAALAVLAGGEIARRGLAPLARIASLVSEIEARDLARRLALPERDDELGRLAATFDRMLDRLESAFERERRFTSDASHELRAPLSVIRAEADLALLRERRPADYRRALETIAAEADALEALTADLLAAARGQAADDGGTGPVDLSQVAATVAQRMNVLAQPRRVRIDSVASRPAVVHGNRALIERALVSVVHNALKYSPDEGCIEVRVSEHERDAELLVRDAGPGFSSEALQRGTDRFWRDDDSRAMEGSGLGLSLAKTIVEGFGGTIALSNAGQSGAIVRMTFPAASS